MIAVVDYEIGNLGSVVKAFKYLDIPVILTRNYQDLQKASGIILPGVGAFGEGMANLRKLGLEEVIKEEVDKGKPFFGICLGMQLLFSKSEEEKEITGLNLIEGQVKMFDRNKVGKIPQIGWNQVDILKDDLVFNKVSGDYFYFVHSYFVLPDDDQYVLGKTTYGEETFASVVRRNNIWGMQCHPEKSGRTGLKVLKNFSEVVLNGDYTGN
jgi:glutamine amidotransferase